MLCGKKIEKEALKNKHNTLHWMDKYVTGFPGAFVRLPKDVGCINCQKDIVLLNEEFDVDKVVTSIEDLEKLIQLIQENCGAKVKDAPIEQMI